MIRKSGFTMIELILVIATISLVIISLVPVGMNMYNNARKKSLSLKVNGLVDAAKVGYNFSTMDIIVTDTVYEFVNGEVTQTGNIDIEYSGERIENGKISIKTSGEIAVAIYDGKFCAIKLYLEDDITVSETILSNCVIEEPQE